MTGGAPLDAPVTPADFAARMAPLHGGGPLALAVSGGGDSMALMALAAEWAGARETSLLVLTVDHGLRAGSADDAAFAQAQAQAMGLNARRLTWRGEKPESGVQAAAREARYRLMAEACGSAGIGTLALAHTLDDQAETALMRLARGAGVDGLAAMAPATSLFGLRLIRPLLGVSRDALRATLRERGLQWREDPSNDDTTFERVRARRALAALAPLGIDAAALARTAERMAEAREALDAAAADLAARAALFAPLGVVRLRPDLLANAPREIALRLLSAAMRWASGAAYAPRREDLNRALGWVVSTPTAGGRTLHGCQFDAQDGEVTLSREPAACAGPVAAADIAADIATGAQALWDGRFFCAIDDPAGASDLRIAALGPDGAREVKAWGRAPGDWRAAPRAARLSSPALWRGETLVHAPFAGYRAEGGGPSLDAFATAAPFSLKGPAESLC